MVGISAAGRSRNLEKSYLRASCRQTERQVARCRDHWLSFPQATAGVGPVRHTSRQQIRKLHPRCSTEPRLEMQSNFSAGKPNNQAPEHRRQNQFRQLRLRTLCRQMWRDGCRSAWKCREWAASGGSGLGAWLDRAAAGPEHRPGAMTTALCLRKKTTTHFRQC